MLVFDARDGSPAAFLLDHGFITDLRTGAAGGVAARHLAPEQVGTVAVIGTGVQARHQLDALAIVRPGFTHVRVWGRDPERAAVLRGGPARPGLPEGCAYAVADTVEAGARAPTSSSRARQPRPLVRGEWLSPART